MSRKNARAHVGNERWPGARTCWILQVIVRTLDSLLSVMGSLIGFKAGKLCN